MKNVIKRRGGNVFMHNFPRIHEFGKLNQFQSQSHVDIFLIYCALLQR